MPYVFVLNLKLRYGRVAPMTPNLTSAWTYRELRWVKVNAFSVAVNQKILWPGKTGWQAIAGQENPEAPPSENFPGPENWYLEVSSWGADTLRWWKEHALSRPE
jgi:hypothetical protein